jgi:hypothetical protein
MRPGELHGAVEHLADVHQERPCTRCIKRNIGHLCHDEPREPAKKPKQEEMDDGVDGMDGMDAMDSVDDDAQNDGALNHLNPTSQNVTLTLAQIPTVTAGPGLIQPTPVHASLMAGSNMGGMA